MMCGVKMKVCTDSFSLRFRLEFSHTAISTASAMVKTTVMSV